MQGPADNQPHLIVRGQRVSLDAHATVEVPATSVLIEIPPRLAAVGVWLDGRRLDVSLLAGGAGISSVDLSRHIGFHELTAGGHRWRFATHDGKLRLEGILALLRFLADSQIAWSGAMFFSGDDRVLRDARLDKAWLDDAWPRIVGACAAIAREPHSERTSTRRRARTGLVDVARTTRFLRDHRELVEELRHGAIQWTVDGSVKRGAPLEAIVRHSRTTTTTVPNRRATTLLVAVDRLVRGLLKQPSLTDPAAEALRQIAAECAALLRLPPFAGLKQNLVVDAPRTITERVDQRYAEAYTLLAALRRERHWAPAMEVLPERAYVAFADQIFQQFCAHALARAKGLVASEEGATAVLRFDSDEWVLWSNVKPPDDVLHDWRAESTRPADLRPDITIQHRPSGRVAVMDAKYRGDGTAPSLDSLSEAQLYLQAYELRQVCVLYPAVTGHTTLSEVAAADRRFVVYGVPIRAEEGLVEYLTGEVWPRIMAALL